MKKKKWRVRTAVPIALFAAAMLAPKSSTMADEGISTETFAELQTILRGVDELRLVGMGMLAGQRDALALYTGSNCIAHLGTEALRKMVIAPSDAHDPNGSAAAAVNAIILTICRLPLRGH
jgi:hypothetical protein